MMGSWLSVILIVLIIAGVLLFYLRKRGNLPSFLSNLFSPPSEQLVDQLKVKTELEQRKSAELQAVLEAKQKLVQAKARNTILRRDISVINERNVSLIAKKYKVEEYKDAQKKVA